MNREDNPYREHAPGRSARSAPLRRLLLWIGHRPGPSAPRRSWAIALVAALAALSLTAGPASAALGDRPLITWNMQGANSEGRSLWSLQVGNFLNAWVPPVVALQEAGSDPPTDAPDTTGEAIWRAAQAELPPEMEAELPDWDPVPTTIRHTQWRHGFVNHDVYFLNTDPQRASPTDPTPTWNGGRVNLAMVTERAADDVVVVPNPMGSTTNWAARPALGLRLGTTWYFNVHALSSNGGADAEELLWNIALFVDWNNFRNQRNDDWVALGDWNRSPGSMQNLPGNATIYSTGQATQHSGGELDWAVYSHPVPAVNPARLSTTLSDHDPVQFGTFIAASGVTPVFSGDQAVESMAAGGVLDAYNRETDPGTMIISGTRNGGENQSWIVQQLGDGSIRFTGRQSLRCIEADPSGQVILDDCSDGSNQRWIPEYLGNSEFQLHSAQSPDKCMNITGGQTDPSSNKRVILWGCQNTPNERWIFTPASGGPRRSNPVKLSRVVAPLTTLESLQAGGLMDAEHNHTANGTTIVSFHRNGGNNQAWELQWSADSSTVAFKGVASGRCIDSEHSGQSIGPGSRLALFDCGDAASQRWIPEQLDDGVVLLHLATQPDLCMDIEHAPVNPDDGNFILWNCTNDRNQQWIFTPYDGSGVPERTHDELFALPDPGPPAERTAYFDSWSVYANQYYIKNLDTQGIAAKLTTLNYAFENIDPVNLTCFANNKAGSTDESDTTGNDGASDAWADYQMSYTSANSVDGSADSWGQSLKGNFNQLRQLKARYPHLKVLVSLGGWTYSKYFSDVAATEASRQRFVSSCIDLYIRGNLPMLGDDPAGGPGAAAGIFDGFDIDWEFPGSANGHAGNHVRPEDTASYTALLAEFRRQLDALGGTHYRLTAALPSGPSDIDRLQVDQLAQYLDMADIMTYDMHGAWETTGPTNFQAPLYDSSASPANGAGLTVNDAVNHYLSQGLPASKITLGLPFYGRGWTGVPDNGMFGRYQSVTGATGTFPFSQQPGVAMYKELEAAGKLDSVYFDPQSKSSWVYDGTNFWSIETPQSLTAKRQYARDKGLAGVMMFALENDDSASTLLNASTGFIN